MSETKTQTKEEARQERRTKLELGLPHFNGTETYYESLFLYHTDGVQFLAETGQCYWLIDAIGSYQPQLREKVSAIAGTKGIRMQFWVLKVDLEKQSAVLTCHEDTPEEFPAIVAQEIPFTDFVLPKLDIWVQVGSPPKPVLMLPGER